MKHLHFCRFQFYISAIITASRGEGATLDAEFQFYISAIITQRVCYVSATPMNFNST